MKNTEPDIKGLMVCAERIAALHKLPAAPEAAVQAKVHEILFERGNFACWQAGILTGEELCNLIKAHLDTLLFHHANVESRDPLMDPDLWHRLEMALLGNSKFTAERIDFGSVVVQRVDVPPGQTLNENVYGVSASGALLWQIEKAAHVYGDSPYVSITREGDLLRAQNWDGLVVWVDTATGRIVRKKETR